MNKNSINAGMELLYLLRQQRYLYHQLKILGERQRQLPVTNSPEMVLEVISGRRKLIEKLRELEDKLRPIKANWQKVSGQISPEFKSQAHEITGQIQGIVAEITENAPSEIKQHLPLSASREFDELLTEA